MRLVLTGFNTSTVIQSAVSLKKRSDYYFLIATSPILPTNSFSFVDSIILYLTVFLFIQRTLYSLSMDNLFRPTKSSIASEIMSLLREALRWTISVIS